MGTTSRERLLALAATTPYEAALLDDRDALGAALALVAVLDDRRLYVHAQSAMVWATTRGELCVRVEILEGGREARAVRAAHYYVLPDETSAKIRAALVPGRTLDEALTEAFGSRRAGVRPLGERATREGTARSYVVSPFGRFARRGVVEIVERDGLVVRGDVLSGEAAADRLEP